MRHRTGLAGLGVDPHLGHGNLNALALVVDRHRFARHVDLHHLGVAFGGRHHGVQLGAAALELFVGVGLVTQAAHEAPAHARDLLRVERKVLVFGHADRHGVELPAQTFAAQLLAAVAESAHDARLVAHADLAHVDALVETRRQRAHQLAKVHTLLGLEVKHRLVAVKKKLHGHGVHIKPLLGHHLLENGQSIGSGGLSFPPSARVLVGRFADDGLERAFQLGDGGLVDLLDVLLRDRVLLAALRFHDERVPAMDVEVFGVEPKNLWVIGQPYRGDARHTVPLLSQKAWLR